jgi:hypothetical protein
MPYTYHLGTRLWFQGAGSGVTMVLISGSGLRSPRLSCFASIFGQSTGEYWELGIVALLLPWLAYAWPAVHWVSWPRSPVHGLEVPAFPLGADIPAVLLITERGPATTDMRVISASTPNNAMSRDRANHALTAEWEWPRPLFPAQPYLRAQCPELRTTIPQLSTRIPALASRAMPP